MNITRVEITLAQDPSKSVVAFCTLIIDDALVVHEVKLIRRHKNRQLMVAMPNKKFTHQCRQCREKNHLKANYCNCCGVRLTHQPGSTGDDGKERLYSDIIHPIDQAGRKRLHDAVVYAYEEAMAGRVAS